MKKVISSILVVMALLLSSCSFLSSAKKIKVPDLTRVDEVSAKTSLTNKSLLPIIEYEYSEKIAKGSVTRTVPSAGELVEEDTRVTVYVSLGPDYIKATNATIAWYSINAEKEDDWEFYGVEILEDYVYILCGVTFGTSFTLKGKGFGNASLTDTFDKQVPLELLDENLKEFAEKKKVTEGEKIMFYSKISLKQLDAERPTHIACEIAGLDDKENELRIKCSFNASWDDK